MGYINQQKYNAIGITVDLHDKRLEDSLDGIVKSDGSGNISAAIRGVDYDVPELPSQSGQSGKFLTTDGTDVDWATIDALPSQSGQSGKYLTTDGSVASWSTVDALPSQTGQRGRYLTTDGTNASWVAAPTGTLPSQTGQSGKYLTTNGIDASWSEISVESMSTTDIDNAIASA